MAPCVVIGERAGEILRKEYKLRTASIHRDSKSRSGNLGGIDTRESKGALMSTGIASETAKDVVRQNAEEV
jgi:hypothetical protein